MDTILGSVKDNIEEVQKNLTITHSGGVDGLRNNSSEHPKTGGADNNGEYSATSISEGNTTSTGAPLYWRPPMGPPIFTPGSNGNRQFATLTVDEARKLQQQYAENMQLMTTRQITPASLFEVVQKVTSAEASRERRERRSRSRSRSRSQESGRKSRRSRSPHRSSGSSHGRSGDHRRSRSKSHDSRANAEESTKEEEFYMPKTAAEQNAWELPRNMLRYVSKVSNRHMKDSLARKEILEAHPVPKNIPRSPELDSITKSILHRANRTILLSKEKNLRECQNKVRDVWGPLSRLWVYMSALQDDPEICKLMDVPLVKKTMDQIALLTGQAQVKLQYERRMMVLEATANSHARATKLLDEHKEILEDGDRKGELFGKEFREKVREMEQEMEKSAKTMDPEKKDPFSQRLPSNK